MLVWLLTHCLLANYRPFGSISEDARNGIQQGNTHYLSRTLCEYQKLHRYVSLLIFVRTPCLFHGLGILLACLLAFLFYLFIIYLFICLSVYLFVFFVYLIIYLLINFSLQTDSPSLSTPRIIYALVLKFHSERRYKKLDGLSPVPFCSPFIELF